MSPAAKRIIGAFFSALAVVFFSLVPALLVDAIFGIGPLSVAVGVLNAGVMLLCQSPQLRAPGKA
jgi:hypothetical protein